MIRRIQSKSKSAYINSDLIRKYFEGFESELFRGIGTLAILNVIKQHEEYGIYGYKLIKEIKALTDNMLIIEEGTLYPMLRKLENWGSKSSTNLHLIQSTKKEFKGRVRKYFHLTEDGKIISDYLDGFYSKLTKSLSKLLHIHVDLDNSHFIYCPSCANKIPKGKGSDLDCEICGQKLFQIDSQNELVYCPNCGNKVSKLNDSTFFCEMCDHNFIQTHMEDEKNE